MHSPVPHRCTVAQQLLFAAVTVCLALGVEAVNYDSCAGGTVCAGSSIASGNDGLDHCCPTGGSFNSPIRDGNVYCSMQQDCSLPPPPPPTPAPSTCSSGRNCTSGWCFTLAYRGRDTQCKCGNTGSVFIGAQACKDCPAKCAAYQSMSYNSCFYIYTDYTARNVSESCALTLDGGWSQWSACSAATNEQVRTCTNPRQSGGGVPCTGSSTQACDPNAFVSSSTAGDGSSSAATATSSTASNAAGSGTGPSDTMSSAPSIHAASVSCSLATMMVLAAGSMLLL